MRSRPWTAKDAPAKNAALKGKAKLCQLWADTANGTLQSSLKAGHKQEEAEGIAIATANKAVAKKLEARGEPHGDQGRPQKPVRTVTPAPAVTRSDDSDLRTRAGLLTPGSIDLDDHTVEAVLGTERACLSMDLKTKKSFLEVYLMSGAVLPPQVPLCDTHNRESTAKVLGSVRDLRVENDQLVGRLFVASSEYGVWSKIRDKHLTDVSWGVQPLETTEIKPGKTQIVQGRSFTAPADQSLYVHTQWRLREVSVTPIGSDDRAKIRSLFLPGTHSMLTELIRKWLEENMSLRSDATPEEAQTLWDGLSSEDRTRAEEACRESDDDEDEDDEDDDEDEDGKPAPGKKTMHRVTRSSVVTEETRAAEEAERVRKEAEETGRQAERARAAKIRKLAAGDIPEEIVVRAIEEGWKMSRVRTTFLSIVREGRSKSVGGGGNVSALAGGNFSIQTRSPEADCTVASLGAMMLSRSYTGRQDVRDLLGAYQPSAPVMGDDGKPEAGQCYTVRSDVQRMITGHSREGGEERRRAAERLLDMGDRYRGMSMMELVDECNRIEGRTRGGYDREERVRAAMSGSALSAIFTQNISAQFLGGYLDAPDTTQGWVTESDVLNFLQNERAIFGKMGQPRKVAKGGTAEHLDTTDWNEVFKIFRYGSKFTVDEQDFINDRFDAIQQMAPQDIGLTFRQIRPNLVYAHLLSNPTLNQDNTALFHANHNNIVTGAITDFGATTPTANAGPLQDGTTLMGKQRIRNRVLNLQPRHILAGTDLKWALQYLYKEQTGVIVSASGYSYNPLAPERDQTQLHFDGRLDPLGCFDNDSGKQFYPYTTTGATTGRSGMAIMVARPGEGGAKTIEVAYRVGTGRAPRIRSAILREGSGQWGMSWDANIDIGVRALDYRGFVLITGGGSQQAAAAPATT